MAAKVVFFIGFQSNDSVEETGFCNDFCRSSTVFKSGTQRMASCALHILWVDMYKTNDSIGCHGEAATKDQQGCTCFRS